MISRESSLISIIIPVYNAEKYLPKCINSILEQSYDNFEIIIVNDGSTDRSGKISDSFREKDSRINVFYKDNGGVSSARNLGLKKATGRYLCFVDADDYLLPDYLNKLYEQRMLSDNSALVIQACQGRKNTLIENNLILVEEKEKANYFLQKDIMTRASEPMAKLFDRGIIYDNNLEFPHNLQIGEDGIFILKYIIHAQNIIISNDDNYYLRDVEGSLSTKFYELKIENECYYLWKELLIELSKQASLPEDDICKYLWENLKKPFLRTIHSIYKNNYRSILNPKLFNEIDPYGLSLMKKYFMPESFNQRILLFQIKHNYIRSLCLMGYFRDLLIK